jgi:hypothetical protein
MTNKPFITPILFLIFNRPDTTEKVFEKIREMQPRRLFISADGPRPDKTNEKQRCEEARKVIERVDWKCDLKTNLSEKNLGCRVGVSSGIHWFFTHVSEGIILEDDCVPDTSFFHFCEVLLEYYRDDERVMHIGGSNFQDGRTRGTGSYYFSKINHIWGWATWKRAWDKYDVNVSTYPQLLEQKLFPTVFTHPDTRRYWQKNIELVYNKIKDTWDIQWQYTVSVNNGLAIIPNVNLVSNIGFDVHATHTIDNFNTLANRPTSHIDTMSHPMFVVPDLQADDYTMRKYLNPPKLKKLWQLVRRGLAKV